MQLFIDTLLFTLGLIIGSFLSAYTYRWPRGMKISKGRSFCDKCRKKISWYDNIPLFSYLNLRGKCRYCGKEISIRYPLIELVTALLFLSVGVSTANSEPIFIYRLLLVTVMIGIFVIDLESQLIPDELNFLLLITGFLFLLITDNNQFFLFLAAGFAAALFILLLNLITKGRGMGLGDVKLALSGGLILGYPQAISWLFLAFIIGAVVGLVLIAFGKAKFGKQIPFGPFMVISLFLMLLFGSQIDFFLLPFL